MREIDHVAHRESVFDKTSNIKNFLYFIARNAAIDSIRHVKYIGRNDKILSYSLPKNERHSTGMPEDLQDTVYRRKELPADCGRA